MSEQSPTVRAKTTYRTRGGWKAHVSDWGKNLVGEECFRGTEEGIGLGTWDALGKSLSGDERSDLVLPTPAAPRRV